ncbi:hypothetical protein LC048_17900 [Mesobacillus subterraneus]|uniref:hypothetical protein n=1 Tax=Mesobacillus subterraneus TaxID=285983 RepID=UPI001CFDD4C5|nr:hypothetical protein [Mesobacillus subterraneus]WLR54301.1 hypothetical protein LC048_17900 [Mesobacillus subterraneus]
MGTIQGELSKWAAKNKMPIKKKKETEKKSKDRGMSTREIKELMGYYQPTYRRSKGGAIRQK